MDTYFLSTGLHVSVTGIIKMRAGQNKDCCTTGIPRNMIYSPGYEVLNKAFLLI